MRTAARRTAVLVPILVTAGLLWSGAASAACWVNDDDSDQEARAGDPPKTLTISCDLACQADLSGVDADSPLAVSPADGSYLVDRTFSLTVTFPESATVGDRQKFDIFVYDPGDSPRHDPAGDQCFLSLTYRFRIVEGGDGDP